MTTIDSLEETSIALLDREDAVGIDDDVTAIEPSADSEPRKAPVEELFAVDSLIVGVIAMAALTVVQKGIGFLRGVAFGYWLDDVELGRWSLAFGLLNLAAPLIVLGLPGTFGRYLGELLDRGHLKDFLVRTLAFSTISAGIGIGLFLTFADEASLIFFGTRGDGSLILATCLALVGVLAVNVACEIFTALRVNRLVSGMQFLHTTFFTVASVALLAVGFGSAEVLVVVYGVAAAVAAIPGVRLLVSRWRRIPSAEEPARWNGLGAKIAAMAFWIWAINLLANLYETADRYVLIHFAGLNAEASQALVGQYQSSLLLPSLIIGMGAAFGAALLPHLVRSRSAGNVAEGAAQLVAATKLSTVAFVAAGLAALWSGPFLFDLLWRGKYAAGESVLGLVLIHGIWLSAAFLLQNWLWCVDKPRAGASAFLLGLIVNVGLNILLAPLFGLFGVVLATLTGDAVALVTMTAVAARYGLSIPRSFWIAIALPIALAAGALWGTVLVVGVVALGAATRVLVSDDELRRALRLFASAAARLRGPAPSAVSESP